MKGKHLMQRVEACISLSQVSGCCRRKIGCLILDPASNVVISDGYNGPLRRSVGDLCGGATCLRTSIESGTNLAVGCVHAEQNAIYNAARLGASVVGKWLFVNAEPCPLCAKAIVQCGISRVFCVGGAYTTTEGIDILEAHGVLVHTLPVDATILDYDGILAELQGTRLPTFSEINREQS